MHVARIGTETGPNFAFRVSPGTGWVSATTLGMALPDLPAVIEARAEVLARMAQDEHPVTEPRSWHAPVVRPGKILAIGLNYLKHIAEVGKPMPDEPMIFAKYPSSLTGPYDDIEWPSAMTAELDYECELAVVIGRGGRDIAAVDALDAVFGYCVANDVSARDLQRRQPQISLSKSMDTFCPVGPWVTTVDDVPDPRQLDVHTDVNGEIRQASTTGEMLFDVASLVAYLSARLTLQPGDVILTGTPAGVGSGKTPPTYLKDGDVVTCEIAELGRLRNTVVARPRPE